MLDLGQLVAHIQVDDKGAMTTLKGFEDKANTSAEATGNKWSELGGKIASKIDAWSGKILKMQAAALAGMVTASVKAFAEYEQLEGGVKKIFGEDAAKTVMDNAQKAFESAGLSANDYMETVTGFSASLLQSVGGNAQEAAKVADMAVRDMSDNANTFGTDMASIQTAYQGFAKQNYTMLDNLKLGYGGTKQEMERLLQDAGQLAGKKYDISNLNDVYEAIHVIQEEQNIAGTTAAEASKTIEGSFNAMKSSWTNLLTAIGTGDDNAIAKASKDFGKALKTFVKNVTPVVKTVGKNVGKALFDALGEAIGSGKAKLVAALAGLPALIKGLGMAKAVKEFFNIGKDAENATKSLGLFESALGKVTAATGLSVAGLGALVAILAATAYGFKEAWEDAHKYRTEADEMIKQNQEQINGVEESKELWDDYSGKLEKLAGKHEKTAADLEEMQIYVDELNELYPGLNASIDENGNVIDADGEKVQDLTEYLKENGDAWIENAEKEAYAESLKRAIQDKVKHESDYDTANKSLQTLQATADQQKSTGYIDPNLSKEIRKQEQEVRDSLKAIQKDIAEVNKQQINIKGWDTLAKEAKQAGVDVTEGLKESIEAGKYALPQSKEDWNALVQFDQLRQASQEAGVDIPVDVDRQAADGNFNDAISQLKQAAKDQNVEVNVKADNKKANEQVKKTGTGKNKPKDPKLTVKADTKKANSEVKKTGTGKNKPKNPKITATADTKKANSEIKALDKQKMKDKKFKGNFSNYASQMEKLKAINDYKLKDKTYTVTKITKTKNGGKGGTDENLLGLDFVPYDEYNTNLHYGEMVLTRNEANKYRKMQQQADYGIVAASKGSEAPIYVTVVSELDGREIARGSARYMRDELNTIDRLNNRKLGFA